VDFVFLALASVIPMMFLEKVLVMSAVSPLMVACMMSWLKNALLSLLALRIND
jgi:hypothetical protein